ncbi:hypothetical protein EYC59_00470 [Candidatus Saccharibacteria bacterium]|nr:MAG: hypothetical protein EYC59_00470 [Candidatus Saccharibacteria bacterium]
MAKASVRRIVAPSVIGLLFVFLAGRIAFTRTYPLPYDESYHLGLIDYYTQYPNPFATTQPAGFDQLGSIVGDASHLYHYLLSFPLEFIRLFTGDQLQQLWVLRSLNIGLGLLTLYLVYRFSRRFGLSNMVSAAVTVGLAVTPVFYSVFAQLNYDNLLIPLTLIILLQTWTVSEKLKQGVLPTARLLGVSGLLLAASLVKYSFLPIFAAVALYLAVLLVRYAGIRTLPKKLWDGFAQSKAYVRVAVVALFFVASGVWLQQYGTNVVKYGTPHPQCHVVLSVERCQGYTPWARNYELHNTRDQRPVEGLQLASFTGNWLREMYFQTFSLVRVEPGVPLFSLQKIAWPSMVVLAAGMVCMVLLAKAVFRYKLPWVLFGTVGLLYVGSLWGQNFSDYQNLHQAVAVQGRYLLPLLPLFYVVVAFSYVVALVHIRAFMAQATASGAQTFTAIARFVLRKAYAAWLMVAVKASGAAHPSRDMRFLTGA